MIGLLDITHLNLSRYVLTSGWRMIFVKLALKQCPLVCTDLLSPSEQQSIVTSDDIRCNVLYQRLLHNFSILLVLL